MSEGSYETHGVAFGERTKQKDSWKIPEAGRVPTLCCGLSHIEEVNIRGSVDDVITHAPTVALGDISIYY